MQILILGMHRSGTSVVTRLLSLMGCDLGPEEQMMSPKEDNPRGYWERLDVYALNEELLDHLGAEWDQVADLDLGSLRDDERAQLTARMAAVVGSFRTGRPWVLKDPRMSLLLPLWRPVLTDPKCVIVYRRPLQVAESLRARDSLALPVGVALWEAYTRAALLHTAELPRILVSYERVVREPMASARAILEDLRRLGVRGLRLPAADEIEGFVTAELFRAKGDPERERSFLNPERSRLVETLEAGQFPPADEVAEPSPDALAILRLHGTAARLAADSLSPDRGRQPGHLHVELERARRELADQREQAARSEEVLHQEYRAVVDRLRDLLQESDTTVRRLGRELEESTASWSVERAATWSAGLDEAREEALAARDREFARSEAQQRELAKQVQALEKKLGSARRRSEAERARARRREASWQEELDQLRTSKGMRIEELETELDELRKTLQVERGSMLVLQAKLSAMEGRESRLAEELGRLEEARATLEKDLTAAVAEHLRLRADLEHVRSQRQEVLAKLQYRQRELEQVHSELGEVRCELNHVRAGLDQSTRDRQWLHERSLAQEQELAAIHGSRMWRLWMGYHAVRRFLLWPVAAIVRGLRGLGEVMRRAGRLPRRALGWCYLLAWTVARLTRAAGRRLVQEKANDVADRRGGPARVSTRGRRPRVLSVCPYPIYPPNHGAGVRLYNLLKRVAEAVDLHLLVFIRAEDDPALREALEPMVSGLHLHHWKPALRPDPWGLVPPSAQLFASREVRDRIRTILSEQAIDILQLEFTELAQFARPRYARVKVVLSEIDITFRSSARRRSAGFHRRYRSGRVFGHTRGDWMRQLRYEVLAVEQADQVQVMSEADADYLAAFSRAGRRNIRTVPNAVDTRHYRFRPSDERSGRLLFLGNFQHLPNRDALDYLMAEIWPRVRRQNPRAELSVVGAEAGPAVQRYGAVDGVTVMGSVPDPRDVYCSHRALLAPIRAGSGTRLKILEAMSCGTPVVSTRIGAEGIEAADGRHLLIADGSEEFATAVARLLDDEALGRSLGTAARALVEEHYDWDRSADALLAGWSELLDGVATRPAPAAGHAASASPTRKGDGVDVSVIIPTLDGGALLERTLRAVREQRTERAFDIVVVDSGSSAAELAMIERFADRLIRIDQSAFDHGLTRDLGARESRGRVLVYLNQDAVPCGPGWLELLTAPLFDSDRPAAVQGGILEWPETDDRFYWDSCGERFYFTRESEKWIERFFGIGFSTVNAAIRRSDWERVPFGEAPIMEDKKWQRQVVEAGRSIVVEPRAAVYHTHNYGWRSLVRRCHSEGYGWRTLGVKYSLLDMARDLAQPRVYADWWRGFRRGRLRTGAELLFPWVRPLMLFWGNRSRSQVRL